MGGLLNPGTLPPKVWEALQEECLRRKVEYYMDPPCHDQVFDTIRVWQPSKRRWEPLLVNSAEPVHEVLEPLLR